MKRTLLLICTLLCANVLWAQTSFWIGDLQYEVTSTNPPEVEVNDTEGLITTANIPSIVSYDGINYSVTSIGSFAFRFCSSLTSVTIPNSVTSIGEQAFSFCSSLTSINIPNSVNSIGDYAFAYCSSLTSVNIPNSVTSIGREAFYYCTSLESINLSDNITSIGRNCFDSCINLTTVNIPTSLSVIDTSLFRYCTSLTSITIPENITDIKAWSFWNCHSLTSINIPNSVNSIGEQAFAYCNTLSSVTLGNSVTSIGYATFYQCSNLSSINFPNSLISIGHYAFDYCSSLTSIDIPNSVTSIGNYAFAVCNTLSSVTLGNSITSIGYATFYDCSNLSSINIPNSITSIGEYAFRECSSLSSIDIPNSVTSIGYGAFLECNNLTSVTIPNSVTSIGGSAFRYCTGLESINLSDNITSIGRNCFDSCINLTTVNIPTSLSVIDTSLFRFCTSLTSVTIPENITKVKAYAFIYCSSLTSVTLPESVNSIETAAFRDCKSLSSVTLPENATISTDAFYDSGITANDTIDNVIYSLCYDNENIGNYTFEEVFNITFNIGDNVYTPSSATVFDHTSELNGIVTLISAITYNGITYPVTSIDKSAFYGCESLDIIDIPNSVTSIGEYAFAYCGTLFYVTLGNSVNSIEYGAFGECNNLFTITCLANTPPSLGDYVFYNTPSNKTLNVNCGLKDDYISSWTDFNSNNIHEITFVVNATANDEAFGSVAVENNCSTATLTATANSGYIFLNWNDGNTENPRVVSLTSDTSFIANFITATVNTDITATICQGQTYTENGFNVSEAGTYTQTLTAINGADSIVTLTLNVNPIFNTELTATICQGQAYTENGFNVSEAGVYTQTLQTVNGCDSIVTLSLNVNPIYNTELSATICEGQVYTENNFNISEAGVYTQTLTSVNGCDSIVTLTLNVNPTFNTELSATICEGQVYTENNFNVSEAGVYTQILQTINGCDSIVTLTLNVNPIYNTELTATICEGQVYTENNFNVSEAGVYTQTLQTINGCDSIVTLTLNVNPIFNTELSANICQGQVYAENGFNVSEAGVYTQTLQTVNGCDSIVTLTLNVNPIYNTELTATICEGQTYTENGFNVNEAGVYTQTLTSVNGCDSIVTLTVSVNPTFDTTITATINAGEMYSEFGFNESEAGTYVQNLQTVNGCDSTITLILDVNSSLMDVVDTELSFYPNPTNSKITFSQMIEKIEVIDLTGKVIFTFRNESEINVESLPAGAYYLRLTNNDKAVLRKLIKE